MEQPTIRTVKFEMQPQLLSKQLGSDLYSSPADALSQLVANCLDADCSRVDVDISYNEMGGVQLVTILDDGRGMSPEVLDIAFSAVGHHTDPIESKREVIGSRGIGRFAVFALAAESRWKTVAEVNGATIWQSWTMGESLQIRVTAELVQSAATGTKVTIVPKHTNSVLFLLSSPQRVKRSLFNAFAGYLLRYKDEVSIIVNGEEVDPDSFVDASEVEEIEETEAIPAARLNHLLLSPQVEQDHACMLQFATRGATIWRQPIDSETVRGKKYLGLVDSPYLSELTNTAKSELAMMDDKFRALEAEANSRAKKYIETAREDGVQSFLEKARSHPSYPYKDPPKDMLDSYGQLVYDNVLVSLEKEFKISTFSSKQQQLVFLLAHRLQKNDDLAEVLTSVLQLRGEHVTKFAELLKSTSLNSIIAVSELLVGRIRFLDELHELVYGQPSKHVSERSNLQKIIQRHTWLFGEEYNLMGSDISIDHIMDIIRESVSDITDDEEACADVAADLRDIPDYYLIATKWIGGAKYNQHLIVEIKKPSVRIVPGHIQQLKRYANKIVAHPSFSQRRDEHRFTFVLVSSEVSQRVKTLEYQADEEQGLISRPSAWGHPTELWTLQWSDFIERRKEELRFLRDRIEVTANPEDLAYLRREVGEFLPQQLVTSQVTG